MTANATPPEDKSSVPSLFNVQIGTLTSLQDHSVLGTWQAAATSKNPFRILKRFLQIRPYIYGKFSL